ncbi:L,D-transpeptidase [Rhodopseudomonas palustris]|nr:L,D-transpeptidase [Rhodopseudomonas palustris]
MITSGIASRRSSMAPLLAFAAAILLTAALPGGASAQMLGYAAAPQAGPFEADDEIMAAPPRTASPDEAVGGDDAQLADRLRRQVVAYDGNQPAGTIVIDTANTYLYYVLGGGRAIRYGVGVGREGFTWAGTQTITRKAEWPDWHPPAQMIARQPYLPRFMAGGPGNPLGARAMYLGSTQYRIHGTNDPSTIGKYVSSGCIRLTNEDVADLFSRVNIGARVVVLPKSSPNREARKARPDRQAMIISVSSVD